MRVCAPTVLPACEFSRVFVRQGVGVEERNNGLLGNVTNRRSRPRRDASRDFTTTGRRRRRGRRRGKEREKETEEKRARDKTGDRKRRGRATETENGVRSDKEYV